MTILTNGWLCGASLIKIVLLFFIWEELKDIRRKIK